MRYVPIGDLMSRSISCIVVMVLYETHDIEKWEKVKFEDFKIFFKIRRNMKRKVSD